MDENETTDPTGQPIFADPIVAPLPAPQVDAFGLPPVAEPFTAALHPDDATARCAEILDNMHGSDDQRRKVVQALVERFGI